MTLLHQLMVAERQRELRAAARELRRAEPRPALRRAWRPGRTPGGRCPAPVGRPRALGS